MSRFDGIRRALRVHFGVKGVRRAIDDEIAFHLDTRVRALREGGLSENEARETALREFGDVAAARDDLEAIDRRSTRRRARLEWMADIRRDIIVGVRSLRRQPVLTLAILITLALGIGANAAIFTVMQAALLAPLPYDRGEQLVHLWETRAAENDRTEYSYPNFVDVAAGVRALSHVEGYDPTNVIVRGSEGPLMIQGGRVTAGFLTMLGVAPTLGRTFVAGEDAPGAPRVVVLSDAFWRGQFGGDRAVVGRSLTIDNQAHEIVGVLPAQFHFAPIGTVEVWMPINQSAETRAERFNHWLNVVARLRDGTTDERANAELATVMRRLATEHPQTNAGRGGVAVPLRDEIVGNVRPLLLVVTGAVTLVLLIACANVAGLLLARSLARTRELAIRTALGASRWRLVRQLITESVMLSVVGGALAIWVAGAGANLLVATIPDAMRSGMPYWTTDIGTSFRTASYSMAIALASGLAFGLIPALSGSRTSLRDVLRRGGRGVAGGGARLRDAIVAGEIALTIVLLVGTGLLVRSLDRLLRADTGFDAEQVMTARIALAGPRYATDAARRTFFEDVLERVRAVPGVRVVGAVSQLPLNGGGTNTFRVIGAPEPPASGAARGDDSRCCWRLFRGASHPSGGRPPIHRPRRLRIEAGDHDERVVGPETLRRDERRRGARAVLRVPGAGLGGDRRRGRREDGAARCERTAHDLLRPAAGAGEPDVARHPRWVSAVVERGQFLQAEHDYRCCSRGGGGVRSDGSGVPGSDDVGAGDALTGSVCSTLPAVARRTVCGDGAGAGGGRPVRRDLVRGGAADARIRRPYGVRRLARRDSRCCSAPGRASSPGPDCSIGVPGALALTRLMRGMLYGVGPSDPLTYVAASAVLVTVALLASWVPARRATRIQPTVALTAE